MPLTKEDRIELLARARQAKANKKLAQDEIVVNVEPQVEQPPTPKVKKSRKKNEIAPLPEPVQLIEEDDEEEDVIEVPVPVPKKKAVPNKFLKLPKIEPQKCCTEIVSHEEPLITDDKPQVIDKNIIIPSKKQIVNPRRPRASTPSRTLDIVENPREIDEVMEDIVNNDMKYRAPQKQVKQVPTPSTPSAPIQIIRKEPALRLFDY